MLRVYMKTGNVKVHEYYAIYYHEEYVKNDILEGRKGWYVYIVETETGVPIAAFHMADVDRVETRD